MCDNSDASKIDYKAIFESVKDVLIGHCDVFNGGGDVPIFVVFRYDKMWRLRLDYRFNRFGDGAAWIPKHWRNLKGEELCRVINEDYELYKAEASGKDKYTLKHFKPSINDAVLCYEDEDVEWDYAVFESKESAILAGKLAIFLDNKYRNSKNKPDWVD